MSSLFDQLPLLNQYSHIDMLYVYIYYVEDTFDTV